MENVKAARLDGDEVSVEVEGNTISFEGTYGSSNITSGGGNHTGSGSGGSGSAGGSEIPTPVVDPVIPVEPTVPIVPSYGDTFMVDWYYECIEELTEKGIVSGDGTGNFRPNDNITREQFLKMLIEAMDVETEEAENTFTDVKNDQWYKSYVLMAKNLGIVNGISETEFGIGSNITRQDMTVMITRAVKELEIEIDENEEEAFADEEKISDYAKEAVMFMKSIGLIEGYKNEFRPGESLTRAEAAKVISELLGLIESKADEKN